MNIKKRVLVMTLSLLGAVATFAQSYMKLSNVTVKKAMTELRQKSGYSFVYEQSDLDTRRKISIAANSPQEAINQILQGQNVNYEIRGKNVVISKAQSQPSNNKTTTAKQRVHGTITDNQGNPVIGATIKEHGTGNGTTSDLNGNFELSVGYGAILDVSYVGFQPQTIPAGNGQHLDIRMNEDNNMLEDVVVVGYGTQKKINLTGAVSAVKGDDIARRPVANTSVLLQGQIPGLRINQDTGQPGEEGVTMRVRGQGTYSSAGSDPMVLINGVPGSISSLDPSVIESVSVLKDAASAAIYGARAANGVILITTKQGTAGKTHLSYHGNIGFHSASRLYDNVTNSVEYMELANLAWKNSGKGKSYTQEQIDLYRNNPNTIEYPSFDWQGYMFRTAAVQTHNVTMSGGNDAVMYNVALNYVDQPGVMKGFDFEKYNATINLTANVNKHIRFGTYTSLGYKMIDQPRQGQADSYLSTLSQPPMMMPWLPDDGTGITRWSYKAYSVDGHNKNMPAIVAEKVLNRQRNFDLNSQMWLEVNLLKGLTWFTKGAARLVSGKTKDWRGADVPVYYYHTGEKGSNLDKGGNGLNVNDNRRFYTNFYTYLKYDLSLAANSHNFSLMVGYNQESEKYETLSAYRKEYPFELQVIDAGGKENWTNGGSEEEWAIQSLFGRLNYNFMNRYLFEANMRYDGTSRIASENRWGVFPSFSLGWRVTEEPFFKKMNASWLDNLKIRASWGQLGNQNIGLYPYQALIDKVTDYPFGYTASDVISAYQQTAYANRNIKWETTTVTDLGFEFQLFKNLNVTLDLYNKETKDILRTSQVSATLGLSAPYINDGTVRNRGVELDIKYSNAVKDGFFRGLHYNVGAYFDHSKNKLIKFGADEIHTSYILSEGLPYREYYMLECIGVFADQAEIDASPKQFNDKTLPGDLKYRDVNQDGIIDNEDKRTFSGHFPNLEYALHLGANWKGFDFSFIGQGVSGIKHYTTGWGVVPFQQGSSPNKEYVANMWTEDNPYNAKHPRIYYGDLGGSKNTRANSYFLKDASFFRVKNITLGYTLPRNLTSKLYMSKVRVYFSGDNMFLITPYKGLDPEREDGDDAHYPQNKIYSFGINVEF